MQLGEQHIISKSDPRYAIIDRAAFASKNLYNAANYLVRQAFLFQAPTWARLKSSISSRDMKPIKPYRVR